MQNNPQPLHFLTYKEIDLGNMMNPMVLLFSAYYKDRKSRCFTTEVKRRMDKYRSYNGIFVPR